MWNERLTIQHWERLKRMAKRVGLPLEVRDYDFKLGDYTFTNMDNLQIFLQGWIEATRESKDDSTS